jgi:hypothetical protein
MSLQLLWKVVELNLFSPGFSDKWIEVGWSQRRQDASFTDTGKQALKTSYISLLIIQSFEKMFPGVL